MSSTEDKILEEAVEIALSQPELNHADMVDIIQQSTGKSRAIAEQAIQEASDTLIQSIEKKETEESASKAHILIAITGPVLTIFVAYKLISPILIGDRSIMDGLAPQEEIRE